MIKKMKLITAAATIAISAHASAGSMVAGALEPTQLLNMAELVAIYAADVEQLTQQIKMYQDMVQNTAQLPLQAWSSIEGDLIKLVDTISGINGVVNAQAGALEAAKRQFGDGGLLDDYQNRLRNWSQGLTNQAGAALESIGMNINQFGSRQQALRQIQMATQTSQGRMQVLQAGNQIAGLMVNEIQSLHGTIAASNQALVNAAMVKANKEHQDEERLDSWLQKKSNLKW